jgi:hypothetical protein
MRGIEIAVSRGRRRNVMGGEGMLTPKSNFTWGGELYEAGRTRVTPDHPVTASNFAGLLKPAYAKESSHEVLRFLERRVAERKGTRRPSNDYLGRANWLLDHPPGHEPWRL